MNRQFECSDRLLTGRGYPKLKVVCEAGVPDDCYMHSAT